MSGPVLLQCSITGYQGAGVTLFGALDPGTGLVSVLKEPKDGKLLLDRAKPGFAFVANTAAAEGRDVLFADEHLRDAIAAYFDLQARARLTLDSAVTKHNPANAIEPDGVDERGRKYRLAESMSNGQMAVIVMAWFARRQGQVAATNDAWSDIFDAYSAVSVGLPGDEDDF